MRPGIPKATLQLTLALLMSGCASVTSPDAGDADAASDAAADATRDGGVEADAEADAGTDAGVDAGTDASVDAGPPATPSPANVGWIGGACMDASSCTDVPDATCLRDGFPNGMCTSGCTGLCPDRGGSMDTLSFCVDGAPYGESRGLCFARCDADVLPPTACPEGYVCQARNRFGSPRTSVDVCVPERDSACPGGDRLIPVGYPDDGAIWIPQEAACGGLFDVLVMLHGINPSSSTVSSLGGGRNLQQLARAFLDEGRIEPLILVEPVHFQGSSSQLWGPEFDPVAYLQDVMEVIGSYGIRARSISFMGHSGAGCNRNNGLYKVLEMRDALVPRFAPSFRMIGFVDVCYGGAYHWEIPLSAANDLTLVNMLATMGTEAEADTLEAALLETPTPFACDARSWRSCMQHPRKRWCSYRGDLSTGIDHDTAPYWFFREVIPRVFSTDPSVQACH